MHRPSLYYHLFRRVYAALCMPAVCLLAGLPLSAQSGDGRIEIPADQITCICPSGGMGSITVTAEGSAGPFTFLWAGPGGYASTEQNPADLPAPGWYSCAGGTRQIDCARCEPRREQGLLAMLWDDDRDASHQILPYNLAQDPAGFLPELDKLRDAYLETSVIIPVSPIAFFPTINLPNYRSRVYNSMPTRWVVTGMNSPGIPNYSGVWYASTCFGWQTGDWVRDADPNSESPLNLGATFATFSNLTITSGGALAMVPFETFFDYQQGLTNPTRASISFIHEIGHLFGLDHIVDQLLMNPILQFNTGGFIEPHLNIIRCRKHSPGN